MNVGLVMVLALGALAAGYFLYGRLVARWVGVDPARKTPAEKFEDGVDYVSTRPFVLFGHHYASIAAAGPIVGPAIALAYGWVPAMIWMVLGVILIGAVHDFTSLFVSMREGGKSIGEVARSTLGKGGFFLYVIFALILCVLVGAVFLGATAKALTSHLAVLDLNLGSDQTLLQTRQSPDVLGKMTLEQMERRKEVARENGVAPGAIEKVEELWYRSTASAGSPEKILDPDLSASVGGNEKLQKAFQGMGLVMPFSSDAFRNLSAAEFSDRAEEARGLGVETSELVLARRFYERARKVQALGKVEQEAVADDLSFEAGRDAGIATLLHESRVTQGRVGGIASASVVVITLFAPFLGLALYRRRLGGMAASAICVAVCGGSILIGFYRPLNLDPTTWQIVVLFYCVVAAYLPVWIVLQPRDFANVHLLFIGLAAMILGVVACGIKGFAINLPAESISFGEGLGNLGVMWPVLFVTIACGSVSGAHGLVCAGTTSKQVSSERHIQPIGYGSMLMEAVLGICVVLCMGVGLTYAMYQGQVVDAKNIPAAFASGVGQTLYKGIGFPAVYGTVFGILLLEGFLVTTTDTIIRLARYLLEEVWGMVFKEVPRALKNRLVNTLIIAGIIAALAFTSGYLLLWPIFGAANQLLAALTLIAATAWLLRKGKKIWFTLLPAIFMTVTTIYALALFLVKHVENLRESDPFPLGSLILSITSLLLLLLAAGFVLLTVRFFMKLRR